MLSLAYLYDNDVYNTLSQWDEDAWGNVDKFELNNFTASINAFTKILTESLQGIDINKNISFVDYWITLYRAKKSVIKSVIYSEP